MTAATKEKTMSETVLILRAQRYEFPNEKTGEIIKGCNVHLINDYQVETENAVGDTPMKISATDEVFAQVKKFKAPGIYEINMRTKPGKEGQATVVVTQAKFVRAFSLENPQ